MSPMTADTVWIVQSDHGHGDGWKDENTESTFEDGLRSLRQHQADEPGVYRLIAQETS